MLLCLQVGGGGSCVGMEHLLANAIRADWVSVIQDACQGLAVRYMYQEHKVLIPHCRTMKTTGLIYQT